MVSTASGSGTFSAISRALTLSANGSRSEVGIEILFTTDHAVAFAGSFAVVSPSGTASVVLKPGRPSFWPLENITEATQASAAMAKTAANQCLLRSFLIRRTAQESE